MVPIRWVISPVVEVGGSRRPKVQLLPDMGRPFDVRTWDVYGALQSDFSDEVFIEKIVALPAATEADILGMYSPDDYPYLYFRAVDLGVSTTYERCGHSSAIDKLNWCLCFVRAQDMSAVDADSAIDDVLEHDYEGADNYLAETPNTLSWSDNKTNSFKGQFEVKGVDFTGLAKDDPLWMWLQQVIEFISPGQGQIPKGMWVPDDY